MRARLDLNTIDLNLLPKFRALYRRRNVSGAAKELHLTQSALSNALARMRAAFGDELFVHAACAMEPTPFAHAIAGPIERALAKLEGEFAQANGFEPTHSFRTFNIAMTQLAELWLAPAILAEVRVAAPGVLVNIVALSDRDIEDGLASASIDFFVGHLPDLKHDFRDTVIGMHEIVYAARRSHAVFSSASTPAARSSCALAEILEHGATYGQIDQPFDAFATRAVTRYRTANASALPSVLATTDLIGIVPAWYASRHASALKLRLVRPGANPTVAIVRLYWHANAEADPGHRWMRSIVGTAAAAAQIEEASFAAPIDAIADAAFLEELPRS
jgi:DNA-binding transcriptional LysR family regulator